MQLYSQPPESTYGFRKCCEAVRAAVPIEVIARRYTEIELLGGRAWFVGRCPLPDHDDHDPSFYIYPPGRFYCYGCDRGGDVIDLEFHCGGYNELWAAMIAQKEEFDVELPRRPEKQRRWQQTKQDIRTAAEEARKVVRRERLFKALVLSGPEFEIEDPKERRAAIRRAWEEWEREMRRIGL
jgi:CHC2 zinc finger